MKAGLLGLFVLATVDQQSLGVGLDVFPEVYAFAARRVDVPADLRLAGCDRTTCRWVVGSGETGVVMTAYVSEWGLGINRLEVGSGRVDAWFGKACLGVVSVILPQETPADVKAIAQRIASTSDRQGDVDVRIGSRGVRFYGMRSVSAEGQERLSCGVVAESF